MSVERVYVEEPVAAAFTSKLVERVRAVRVGPNGADAEIDIGPFTSPRQMEIVERHVADALAKGARLLTGGTRHGDGPGCFYEPTVLAGVDQHMLISQEETFGPVIPLTVVHDAEEALRLANDSPYGLNASVWTRDIARGIALAQRIESGNACVNECLLSAGVPELPFGGVKQSGVGTRHAAPKACGSSASAKRFSSRRAIARQRPRGSHTQRSVRGSWSG